jgi:hypothetical protein
MTDSIRPSSITPGVHWAVSERTDDFKSIAPARSPALNQAMSFISRWDPVFAVYPRSADEAKTDAARISAELQEKLPKLNGQQRAFLQGLRELGVPDIDLFHGSHVVIRDGGSHYLEWKSFNPQSRASSHYPGVHTPQYELPLGVLGSSLFGLDGQGNTFVQLEAAPWERATLFERARHSADYLLHVTSGKMNIGPLGLSPRSEKVGKELHVIPA